MTLNGGAATFSTSPSGAALLVPFRGEPFTSGGVPYYRPEPVALVISLGPSLDFAL